MSGLITKATKRRAPAPQKIRATKGKKSLSRKPTRPGKITAKPTTKKTAAVKRTAPAKKTAPKKAVAARKSKQVRVSKKLASRSTKKELLKKPKKVTAAKRVKTREKKALSAKKRAVNPLHRTKTPSKALSRKAVIAKRRFLAPTPVPPPPKKPPSPGTLAAVRAFEQALRLFNRHDFSAAKPAFQSLLSKFAEESEILARVRTYLVICDQRLARAPQMPRNADALYDQGVVEFNRGNTTEAVELFQKALKADPRADHVYYSLAAAHARLEDTSKALDSLRRAIVIRPIHRSHARRDLDFAGLRSNEDFQQLTGFGFDLADE
ncbi:MAG TPA: tetratricopeptide repeat protein [Blastocatellia bacterium]|nr:tetratricopeptide repeat protein [Blastocatellia bacterium]